MAKRKTTKPTGKRKKNKKRSKLSKRSWLPLAIACVAAGLVWGSWAILSSWNFADDSDWEATQKMPAVCERTEKNYGREIDSCARLIGIPASYLKSLVCLECSGKKGMPKRYESHVYKRLKKVRDGEKAEYEGVTTAMLHDASDDALKNLATSWGPFQIMGYKCLHLHIHVADLRGDNAVYWGARWIAGEYGRLLMQDRYKDAFHYHNTGRVFPADGVPATHDASYVPRGLKYLDAFEAYEDDRLTIDRK